LSNQKEFNHDVDPNNNLLSLDYCGVDVWHSAFVHDEITLTCDTKGSYMSLKVTSNMTLEL
jgi:hypothetical protein